MFCHLFFNFVELQIPKSELIVLLMNILQKHQHNSNTSKKPLPIWINSIKTSAYARIDIDSSRKKITR